MNAIKRLVTLLLLVSICYNVHSSPPTGWKMSSSNSRILLKGSSGGLQLEAPMTIKGTLEIENKSNNSVQAAEGVTLSFDNGILASGSQSMTLKGTYDPTNTDAITLGDNDLLEVYNGTVQDIIVSGNYGNESIIKGQPNFTSPIVMNQAHLKIGIQSKLTQNISLFGGRITLIDDLRLQDNVKIIGWGEIDLGNFTLELGSSLNQPWEYDLSFFNANDIQLNGYTRLIGGWTFLNSNESSFSHLNGNGNILDLSDSGRIGVEGGHTLYLSDIHIKGLGPDSGSYGYFIGSGSIKMSNVTLELAGDFTLGYVKLYIQGDNCKVICGSTSNTNYTFTVSDNSQITVDHAVLLYENLGGSNTSPFSFASETQNLINGGVIRSAQTDLTGYVQTGDLSGYVQTGDLSSYVQTGDLTGYVQTGDLTGYVQTGDLTGYVQTGDLTGYVQTGDLSSYALAADIPVIPGDQTFDVTDSPVTLTYNSLLTGGTRILLTNTPTGAQSLTLNGGGFFVQFPATASSYFSVANDIALTLTNIVLKDFNTNAISFGTGCSLIFGSGTNIELNDDVSLTTESSWRFYGDSIIDGNGHTITVDDGMSESFALRVGDDTNAATLKIRNAKIVIKSWYGLRCYANAAIELEDVEVCVENSDYAFIDGDLNMKGYVCIRGTNSATPGAITNFHFETPGRLTVAKAATLEIQGNVNFKYKPGVFLDASLAQTKRHLILNDPSSTLHLNGCTFTSTDTAFALDYGNLIVEDNVSFAISSAEAAEAEFGSALDVCIKAGGTLEVGGPLKYVSSSYGL